MRSRPEENKSLLEILEECQKQKQAPEMIADIMERFLEVKARKKGVPIRGTLELTPLCNLDCKMCYVHLNKQQFSNEDGELLSGKRWIELIQQALDMGLVEVTLTGGEALLHPDFDEIFLFLKKSAIRVNLKSNGLLLTEERVAFLKENHLENIQISLYGCDEESYEKVTGHRAFGKTLAAIERVRKAGIPLEVVITPNKYIWNHMEELLRLVESLDVLYSVNPGLIDPLQETGRSGQQHDLTLEQYIELYRMRLSLKGITLPPPCAEEVDLPGGNSKQQIKGIRCGAGRSVFGITWRGKLHPCRLIEWIGADLSSISFSDAWKQINQTVNEYPYPQECVGCSFEGLCPSCIIQHESGAPKGHANKAVCERTRRMIAEGYYVKPQKDT